MVDWASVSNIRKIAGVTTTDFTDAELQSFLELAQKEVNSKIITRVNREKIEYLDQYRQNKIDGSNTIYFCKNWYSNKRTNYLSDTNYDNEVNTTDIRLVQYNKNTQLESDITVSSIDISNCSFTLSTPVNNVDLFVSYNYSPIDPTNPDPIVSQCVSYLASSYLFVGTDGFKVQFGNVRIEPGMSGGKGKQLYDKYQELLQQLVVNANGGALWSDMAIKI